MSTTVFAVARRPGLIRAAVAKIWGAPVARRLHHPLPDCRKCREPRCGDLRKQWGCDAPTDEPVFSITCGVCNGNGCPPHEGEWTDPNRAPCDGGHVRYYRCMSAILAHAPQWLLDFLDAYRMLDQHGVLPVAGGYMNQTALFADACSVLSSEVGDWARLESEHNQKQYDEAQRKRAVEAATRARRGR